ncbi:MAG: NAD(P)H-hydrate epimerase [Phycisphaerae bacterium]|nr:NAD(P)H-hydrate epimerase [Phycisphaerae bacterium]
MRALSREEVRRIDRLAIETLGVSGLVLMENAGRGAADAIGDFLGGSVASKVIAIVAGSGNNGGDGFVVARHLAMRGASVSTFLVCPGDKLTPDAEANLAILRELGHDVRDLAAGDLGGLAEQLRRFEVVVDAVGGTGIRGALRGQMAAAAEAISAAGRPVVAIDIPTGLDCDTGTAAGAAVRAAMTVTFVARKKGFDAPGAAAYTGRVIVADIGVPAEAVAAMPDRADR